MRESIGATWIFSICLTFIVLFTAYLAISVNYAKSFRIKSDIISMIEENEGYNSDMDYNIEQYLLAQAYNANGYCETTLTARDDLHSDWVRESCINISGDTSGRCNACIYRLSVKNDTEKCNNRAYYRVITFFKFDLPVVNYWTTFPVSGESRLVHDNANVPC